MKTVVCFDTEDDQGMEATYAIMSHLFEQYLGKKLKGYHSHAFVGKIKLIKLLREYATEIENGAYDNGLKSAKKFVDARFDDLRHAKALKWQR